MEENRVDFNLETWYNDIYEERRKNPPKWPTFYMTPALYEAMQKRAKEMFEHQGKNDERSVATDAK